MTRPVRGAGRLRAATGKASIELVEARTQRGVEHRIWAVENATTAAVWAELRGQVRVANRQPQDVGKREPEIGGKERQDGARLRVGDAGRFRATGEHDAAHLNVMIDGILPGRANL